MSATGKVLILLIAVFAFGVGWLVNSSWVDDKFDAEPLLNAELLIFDQSENRSARIKDKLNSLNLINFWASWCAPCREEMPVFEAMYQQHQAQGLQIIGITIDSAENAQPMLDSMGISYPILYAENTGMALMATAGNPNGLLPYTILLDQQGSVLAQQLGIVSAEQISAWIDEYL